VLQGCTTVWGGVGWAGVQVGRGGATCEAYAASSAPAAQKAALPRTQLETAKEIHLHETEGRR